MDNVEYLPGSRLEDVIVETYAISGSELRGARAVSHLPLDTDVRFGGQLPVEFPAGTKFITKGLVRKRPQRARDITRGGLRFVIDHASPIVDSIPDDNLRAILNKVKADSSTRRVRNCPSAFKCEKSWDELVAKEAAGSRADSIRYCNDCEKNVYLCETIAEICEATREGKCVAVMAATVADPGDDDFLGYIENGDDQTF